MRDIQEYLSYTSYSDTPYLHYDAMVESFGYDVVKQEDIGYYQGDILYALYDRALDKWGFYVQGYGSCSYCDQLQAMESDNATVEEYRNFQYASHEDITWYDTPEELYNDNREHDWYSYEDGFKYFMREFKEEFVDGPAI